MNYVEEIERAKDDILTGIENIVDAMSDENASAALQQAAPLQQAYDILSEVQYKLMNLELAPKTEDDIPAESIDDRINNWIERLNEIAPLNYHFELEIRPNAKYQRITMDTGAKYGKSVHAFVDDSGNVYKSAGWKTPAKGVRYALEDDQSYAAILKDAQWSGGYLYHGAQSYKLAV